MTPDTPGEGTPTDPTPAPTGDSPPPATSQPAPPHAARPAPSTPAPPPPSSAARQAPSTPAPPPPSSAGPPKSKTAAGVLAIFLGGLGIHRFYLGFTKLGLIMLLISVLSLGILAPFVAIWGFVDGILIFTGSIDKDAEGQRLV